MIYSFLRVILRILFKLIFRLKVIGKENVPDSGPVVLCANHTSNLDPPILGTPLDREVHYMAKAELFQIPVFGFILTKLKAFPVKRGGVSKESIRHSMKLLQEGKMLCIFPEGTRSNAGGMGKKGAASLALKGNAAVVPAAIIGNYVPFKQMTIVFGKPLDLSEFADKGSEGLEHATEKIMSTIYAMKAEYENKK